MGSDLRRRWGLTGRRSHSQILQLPPLILCHSSLGHSQHWRLEVLECKLYEDLDFIFLVFCYIPNMYDIAWHPGMGVYLGLILRIKERP